MIGNDQDIYDWIRELQRSEQPDIDKLETFFGQVTSQIVEFAEKEIELAKAMQDRESLVKAQIKMETLKSAREIFGRGYQIITGRKAWQDDDIR